METRMSPNERFRQIIADAELTCGVTAHENPHQIIGCIAERLASVMMLAERANTPPNIRINAILNMGRPIAKLEEPKGAGITGIAVKDADHPANDLHAVAAAILNAPLP